MATTPCPHCGAAVRVPAGDVGTCPSCQRPLRFIEVPDTRCGCGATVPLVASRWVDAAACPRCGRPHPLDPRRAVRSIATCPRCRRRIDVPLDASLAQCPHCRAQMELHDTV